MVQIIETVSEIRLSAQNIEPLADELKAYHAIYQEYSCRIKQQRQAQGYLWTCSQESGLIWEDKKPHPSTRISK